MTTRYSKEKKVNSVSSGYDNPDAVDDLTIPSCTIEDVDRAVFNLFNEEIPLFVKRKDELKKPPVIFATGERFALLARNRPLRDKSNALILPLISIVRSGIDQLGAKGATQFQGSPILVKSRISKDDLIFQRLQNKYGFKNDDNMVIKPGNQTDLGVGSGTDPGKISSRKSPANIPMKVREGIILTPSVAKNIIEYIEMPPIKQYTANYEITFWTQYTQEMNALLTIMMGSYVESRMRTYSIKTPSGYRFSAFVDAALNPQNNFDDFTDAERLVKYSFTMSVAAYMVAPQTPGLPQPLRRFVSAPNFSFDAAGTIGGVPASAPPGAVPSGQAGAYVLDNLASEGDPMPPGSIGASSADGVMAQAESFAEKVARGQAEQLAAGFPGATKVILGGTDFNNVGTTKKSSAPTTIITIVDPFTGEISYREITVKMANPRKGETVFRDSQLPSGGFEIDFGLLVED